jgi:hypothetical protein
MTGSREDAIVSSFLTESLLACQREFRYLEMFDFH